MKRFLSKKLEYCNVVNFSAKIQTGFWFISFADESFISIFLGMDIESKFFCEALIWIYFLGQKMDFWQKSGTPCA